MTFQRIRTTFVLATVLAVLMAGISAGPVSAGATRFTVTERYAFTMLNCLRTGGRISRAGKCIGFGSGKFSPKRAPLKRSRRISEQVSLPWARKTAVANICGHSMAGSTVDRRFRVAGLRSPTNGESIGCASSWTPRKMAITVMRWWQAEQSYRGWHWRNLKGRDFRSVGIAVVKLSNGRTRLVVNFYGKVIP